MSRGAPLDCRPFSIAILGTDAVLAARPASPVQLAHACQALGFDMTFPASWGDELIAEACVQRLAALAPRPAILCACPHVIERLTRVGDDLAQSMITLVAPPVATARYLRGVFHDRSLHITYAGGCPAGTDPDIDASITPDELLAALVEQGIALAEQPELFDSVLPPDRRRFYSLPGGAPSEDHVASVHSRCAIIEIEGEEFVSELAQRLLAHPLALIHPAPHLGCACSGMSIAGTGRDARAALTALEPPRAHAPVLDATVLVDVSLRPASGGLCTVSHEPQPEHTRVETQIDAPAPPPNTAVDSDRQHATITRRQSSTATPVLRLGDGRSVPRAYAGRIPRRNRQRPPTPQPISSGTRRQTPIRRERVAPFESQRDSRSPSRTPRSIDTPLPNESVRSVPPPPPPLHRPPSTFPGLTTIN